MRYLYADSTPFPLPQNFLATICAGTDACVAILRAEEMIDECSRAVREAEARATRELAQLSALSHRVETALGTTTPASQLPVAENKDASSARPINVGEATLSRIRELASATLDQARQDTLKLRDARTAEANQLQPRAMVLPALSAFLSAHELPDTAWGIRWIAGLAGAATRAELQARTPFGMEATFEVAIPATHIWARAAHVAVLGFDATISLMKKPLVGKAKPMPVVLSEYAVTQVVLTTDRATMRLSKSSKSPSEGIEFVFGPDPAVAEVHATRVDKAGYPLQDGEKLTSSDAVAVQRLWTRVTTLLGGLVAYRTRAITVKLGGVAVSEIGKPIVIAQTVLRALAPYVREIASRTSVPRELALKRELGDGCREELFIHYETVLEKIMSLSAPHQALFDVFGLADEVAQTPQGQGAVVWRLPVVKPPRIRAVAS